MQVLHHHRPEFLLYEHNTGPPPHYTDAAAAPAGGSVGTGSTWGYFGGGSRQPRCGGALHACQLAPAPRHWGTDAFAAASQQCVASAPRLGAFLSSQVELPTWLQWGNCTECIPPGWR